MSVDSSGGNVFADLGVPDAGIALAKATLAIRIGNIIRERKLTQHEAAKILGIGQPKVSDLLRGKLDGFTMDRLLKLLNRLDQEIEIAVRRVKSSTRTATIRVVDA